LFRAFNLIVSGPQSIGEMFARMLSGNSKLFNVLFVVSGAGSLIAYVVLYLSVLTPFTLFVWFFQALPALLLFWAPPLFFTLVVYWLVSRPFLFLPHWGRRIISLLLTFILLNAVPQWVRSHFEIQARDLVSGDKPYLPQPNKPTVLALVVADRSEAKVSSLRGCEDFCLRVLLNDVADGVALFRTRLLPETPNPSRLGTLYRLVPLKECPEIRLSEARWIQIRGKQLRKRIRSKELLQRAANEDLCIVAEEITLSQADIVIATGLVKQGLKNSDAGFNLFADTISAKRIQMHVRTNGILQETYRVTDVTAQLPTAPLIMAFNMDGVPYGIRLKPGFLRAKTRLARSRNSSLSRFLTETLGLNLRLTELDQP
jgi:hypothetical protein